MIARLAASDRAAAVRREIERWIRMDLVPVEKRSEARALADVEPSRPSRAFQVLGAIFGGVAIIAATALYYLVASPDGLVPLFFIGAILLGIVEWRSRRLGHVASGPEIAGAFVGTSLLLGGLVEILDDAFPFGNNTVLKPILAVGALLWWSAAWRWGHWVLGGLGTFFLFLFLGQWPYARVSWLLVATVLVFAFSRASRVRRPPGLTPSQRSAALASLVVSIAALYLSVQWTGYRYALIERFSRGGGELEILPWFRAISLAGTALVPIVLLAIGLRARRRVLLNSGTLLGAISIATLHWHLEAVPHWVILVVGGVAFLSIGLWLRRWLDAAPERHRHGFTSDPLFEDTEESSHLEAAVSAGSLAPEARPAQPESPPPFEGGGGRGGGGGASGSW